MRLAGFGIKRDLVALAKNLTDEGNESKKDTTKQVPGHSVFNDKGELAPRESEKMQPSEEQDASDQARAYSRKILLIIEPDTWQS